ncbi:hypothetical protein HZA96_02120 [Candidatus Woesearchaeota archaeon]|nr:hypothetical protein [Candidatus Woesearchaeota archaeon]
MEEQRAVRGYKSLDLRVEEIKRYITAGIASTYEIAHMCGLSRATIKAYARKYKIELPEKRRKIAKKEYIEKIKEALEAGAVSDDEIAAAVGLTINIIRRLYHLPKIKERRLRKFKKMLDEGVDSLEELVKGLGFNISNIMKYCKEYNLKLPSNIQPYPTKPEIDILIQQGLTLREIGKDVNLTGERVRQYINASGQYQTWLEIKKQKKTRLKQSRTELVYLLEERVKQELSEQSKAYQTVFQYYQNIKHNRNSVKFDKLVELLELYKEAQHNGKKLSLEQFQEKTGILITTIGHIFSRLNIPPCYGNLETTRTDKYKKQALQRSEAVMMNFTDIAYLLEIPYNVVQQYFCRINIKRKKIKKIKCFSSRTKGDTLNYRFASQIYEAIDTGFNLEEISQLTDATPRVIEYAKQHRTTIEPFIIKSLKTLYPDKEIKQSYKPFF